MKYQMNISGGAASAVAWFRARERYGPSAVVPVFADTNSEAADLYRFLDDIEAYAGQQIERLGNDGKTVWDVFHYHTMLRFVKSGACRASVELKMKPLDKHLKALGTPDQVTVLIGMSLDEDDRRERLTKKLAPYPVDFPLCWSPPLGRCDIIDELRDRGLQPSKAYELGLPHDNCNGGCIMAGIEQRSGLLRDDPEQYRSDEEHEQRFIAELERRGRKPFTILKDRRGGDVKNYSLRQLREDIEAGRRVPSDDWRTPCACMFTQQ